MKTFEYYRNGTMQGEIQAKNEKDAQSNLFAQFGRYFEIQEKEFDLFENPELLPIEVQEILQKYSSSENDYESCDKLLNELKEYGYEFEFYLDAEPYDLKLIESTKVFKLENNKWIETEFNPEFKQICLYNDDLKFKGIGIHEKKNN